MTGIISHVNVDKGFGFIKSDDRSARVFFHVRELDRSMPFDADLVDRRVEFGLNETDRGPRAVAVRFAE